jgi:transposase InsO family protein
VTHSANSATTKHTIDELHQVLGCVSHKAITNAIKKGMIRGITLDESSKPTFCEMCTKAKATRQPFPNESKTRSSAYGDLVHTDLWGPAQTETINRCLYYITFTDDFSREMRITFLKRKSDTLTAFKEYKAYVSRQYNVHLHKVRSDQGGEYLSKEFDEYLKGKGIKRQLTVHDSPQQNGVAERLNQMLVEHARAMLLTKDLPKFVWAEAINYTTWLKNHLPSRAIPGYTSYELLHKAKPSLVNAREFGARLYVHSPDGGKLEARAEEGQFVGIDEESKAYRVYWPKKRRVSVEHNISFVPPDVIVRNDILDEGEYNQEERIHIPNTIQPVPQTPKMPIQTPKTPPQSTKTLLTLETPRVTRVQPPPGYYKTLNEGKQALLAMKDLPDKIPLNSFPYPALAAADREPTLKEALSGPDAAEWQEAMNYEIGQLEKLGTWEKVDTPRGANIIPCHFILATK